MRETLATAGFIETAGGTGQGDFMDLSFLEGKRVTKTGFLDMSRIAEMQEGGFAIEYEDGEAVRRVVLGYTDLGIWISWHGEAGKDNPEDLLRQKVCDALDTDGICDALDKESL